MQKLISLISLSVALAGVSPAFAAKPKVYGPYRAVGYGENCSIAKTEAFKDAVGQAMGIAVVSERQSNDGEIARNNILTHSAGYIDKYDVESEGSVNVGCKVVIRAMVKPSMMNDYVLQTSKDTKNVEGDKLGDKINGYMENRRDGDRYLTSVLRDYPAKAYNISQGKFEVRMNDDRDMALFVPYSISFSSDFLIALSNALKTVSDTECSMFCDDKPSFTVSYKEPKSTIGTKRTYYFNDTVRPEKVYYDMLNSRKGNEPKRALMLRADLLDVYNKPVTSYCVAPDNLPLFKRGIAYGIEGGGWKENGIMMIKLDPQLKALLPQISKIEMRPVFPEQCVD
jgi:hypothetical protein